MYAPQNGVEISKLMNFIITHSERYWGAESDYANIYKDRYKNFVSVSLEELASKFTSIYLKTHKIHEVNPITQCH